MIEKGFNSGWLEELKSRADIVSVLSRYIKLERKGKTYWSCCPFHHEKTASFAVNDMEQYYHCFGCKESGDVIKFVQTYESLDFLDAVQMIADSVGMQLPSFSKDDESIFLLKEKKQKLKKILNLTHNYYKQNLRSLATSPALEYLKKRNISNSSIEKFEIGYSKNWDELPKMLAKQGFTVEEMKEAGVVEIGEKNLSPYDMLGERLIFPIFNPAEEVVGFSARLLKQSDFAKYKNTPQTIMFNKSKEIFAINHVKKLKQQGLLKHIIIVEGQIDVIAMHEAGFESAIACLGTALTKEHARILKRYSNEIVFCFDGDTAGVGATIRSIEVLKEFDFDIKVVALPEKSDPDDYIKQYGKEAMKNLIETAKSVVEYKLEIASKEYDMQKADERAKYIKVALDILKELESFSEKQVFLETIRNLSGVPIDVLMRDLSAKDFSRNRIKEEKEKVPVVLEGQDNAASKAVKFVLASVIHKQPYSETKHLTEEFFKSPLFKKVFLHVKENQKQGKVVTVSDLYNVFDIDNNPNLKDVIYYNFDDIGNNAKQKQYFFDSLWTFVEFKLKEKQDELAKAFKETTSQIERKEILTEISNITKQLKTKQLEEI